MENTEEIFHYLEDFSKRKPKVIPQELNDYLAYVARTGDPVYQWSLVKSLFKEKLLNVITDFYETTPSIEIPPYPNVDPFNYDAMKNSLLERLDSFASAPFTVQRICELLTFPRKQYNRVDKFMRAVEKNILVVSTREPGVQRHVEPEPEPENGEVAEPIVNGSDNSEYNVDVEMEDMSWKENAGQLNTEPQPSSSETRISVDDIEARLQAKQDIPMQVQDKSTAQYESVTPPELNVTSEEQELKPAEAPVTAPITIPTSSVEAGEKEDVVQKENSVPKEDVIQKEDVLQKEEKIENAPEPQVVEEPKIDVEMKVVEPETDPLVIPEIKVDDAEMTEQRLAQESNIAVPVDEKPQEPVIETAPEEIEKPVESEEKMESAPQPIMAEESSNDSNTKDEPDSKTITEELTTSEESSSSSENTDGNSNSPKPEPPTDSQDESNSDSNQTDSSSEVEAKPEQPEEPKPVGDVIVDAPQLRPDDYSISDVKSELPQPQAESLKELPEEGKQVEEVKEETKTVQVKEDEPQKTETEVSSENIS